MQNETIFETAQKLITGDRRESYGPVTKSFGRIAKVWSGILGQDVTPQQVALCMIGLKVCREANKPGRDNRVDLCGYAGLLDVIESSRSNLNHSCQDQNKPGSSNVITQS